MKAQKRIAESNEQSRLNQIYYVAARIFCEKGYDAASMNDIAEAVGITKAGIYHYVKGKQELLYAIINFGMDLLEREVIIPASAIPDAEERLRAIITRHSGIIMKGSTDAGYNPLTIVNEEIAGLTQAQRRRILQRKRVYLDLLRDTLRQLKSEGKLRDVDVTVAAFGLFGTLLWLSRWYRPDGELTSQQVTDEIIRIAFGGLLRPQARLTRK